jgi:hypothetical protein
MKFLFVYSLYEAGACFGIGDVIVATAELGQCLFIQWRESYGSSRLFLQSSTFLLLIALHLRMFYLEAFSYCERVGLRL